jgi:hypothetical protein
MLIEEGVLRERERDSKNERVKEVVIALSHVFSRV